MAGFAYDYVGVHERVDQFLEKYPNGRIQTKIAHLSDNLVVMQATVYRDTDDTIPCIAHSQLGIPGKTNFTRDSEVENAETSAVGRALAFMGFETKNGIASREEIQSRGRDLSAEADAIQVLPPMDAPPAAKVAKGVPEWWPAYRKAKQEAHVTDAEIEMVIGEGPTVAVVTQWIEAEEGRHWSNLIAEAQRMQKSLLEVRS